MSIDKTMDKRMDFQIPVIANGCRYAPDCFSCPYSDCVYDPSNKCRNGKQPKGEKIA